MKRRLFTWVLLIVAMSLVGVTGVTWADQSDGEASLLWQIGAFDDDSREFANAPGGYGDFEQTFPQGVLYVVGESDPSTDWNYIHPGVADAWASGQPWSFAIQFDVDQPLVGEALLWIDLIGAHPHAPPHIRVLLNDNELATIESEPGNDAPVYADPAGGQEQILAVAIPASDFREGTNTLVLQSIVGSWLVYDALKLEVYPEGVPEGVVPEKEDIWADVVPRVLPGMVVSTPVPSGMGEKAMLLSLQGIVNRHLGQLYLGSRADDWYRHAVAFSEVSLRIDNPFKVLQAFEARVDGLIVYDPVLPDTLNVAFTLAGLNDAVVVSPQMAEELQGPPMHLPVIYDLTGRFETALEAYEWAYEHAWDEASHDFIINLDPGMLNMQDLQVARRGFAVRLDADKADESALLQKLLADVKPYGVVYGWPPGQSDSQIELASRFGLSYVVTDWSDNLSVYSQGIRPVLRQDQASFDHDDAADVYVTFLMDHAGTFHYNQFHLNGLWKDPARGQVPLGWTIHPRLIDLAPGIINYYYLEASANDYFLAPANLGGLTSITVLDDPEAYGASLKEALSQAELSVAWIDPETDPSGTEHEAELMQTLEALATGAGLRAVFHGRDQNPDQLLRMAGNIPVVSVLYAQGGQSIDDLATRILDFASDTRGFVAVGVDSWSFGPGHVQALAQALQDRADVRVLRPDAWLNGLLTRGDK